MPLKFRGGEMYQRGRGIGGFFRAIGNAFKPLFKSAGTSIVKAVNSKSGQVLGKALKEQALTSVANLSADVLRGNDLGESFNNEFVSGKRNIANVIDNVVRLDNKRRATKIQGKPKKVKRGNVNIKLNVPQKYRGNQSNVPQKYRDNKSNDIYS